MRSAICGRSDNKGLGNMTWEFCRHINPEKIMLINNRFTRNLDRFPGATLIKTKSPSDKDLLKFLEGIDIVLTFETPYNRDLFIIAKKMGVKSVMIPMFELLNDKWIKPDLFICPSKLDYDVANGNKIFLPWPVNDKVLKRRRPKKAETFLFNTGRGGMLKRNSLDEMHNVIKMCKGVKFVVNNQKHFDIENYWDLWKEGDVFVFPHKFAGLSLPIQEAMATGLPVITTDFYPFNEIIPKELLIKPYDVTKEVIAREIDLHYVSVQAIADKIKEVASWSPERIGELSDKAYEYSQNITWEKLLPKYLEILNKLVNNEKL